MTLYQVEGLCSARSDERMVMYSEWERIGKEVVVSYFKLLPLLMTE
jgi:hypothetical protein